MKKVLLFTFFFLCSNTFLFAGGWDVVSKISTKSLSILLEWKLYKKDYRTNPDGSKFYRTELRIKYNDGRKESTYELPDHVYTNGALDGSMTPCMIIDPTYETVTVFVLEKDASSRDYGMTGYAYIKNKGKEFFSKEIIFTRGNFGWYAFFGGSYKGCPTLCHFSFAGYQAMESKRNSNGTWSNYAIGDIKPNVAANQWKSHKNILVTSESNVDKMSGVSNSRYKINPIYDPPKNNSRTTLSEDEKLGLFVGGLFLVGAAIYKGLESLPASSSSHSSSSSSSSYSKSSSASKQSSGSCTFKLEEWNTKESYAVYKIYYAGGSFCETYKIGWEKSKYGNNYYIKQRTIGGADWGEYDPDKKKVSFGIGGWENETITSLEKALEFFVKNTSCCK